MESKKEKLDLRVLYVEDENVVRTTIYEMLRRRISEVFLAEDGEQGLSIYNKEKPALVITDIKMPNMDGLDMIRNIKKDNLDVPVIITSAHSESKYFLEAIDLGVDKFVLKPVNNKNLFRMIMKIYENINASRKVAEEESRRRIAERNLRETQEQIRAVFENALVGMGIVDSDFRLLFANQALARMVYENEESLLSHYITDYLDDQCSTLSRMRNSLGKDAAGRVTRFQSEEELLLPDGSKLWVEISVSAIINVQNIISKFVIVINDINARKISQQERDDLYNSLLSELETAASVQSFFLPDWVCIEQKLLFSNNYTPSTNVGGDLFDIMDLDNGKFVVYIGDISGHGVQGALIMTAVKATIKMLIENSDSAIHPSSIVNQLNSLLTKDLFHNNYMTLFLSIIDVNNKDMLFFNAGHPPVIRFKPKTLEVEAVDCKGAIPIGWMQDYEYKISEENYLKLDEDSVYLFYTDGIFECNNSFEEELGIDGILELLKSHCAHGSSLMLPYMLKNEITQQGFDISTDDFTILSMQLRYTDEDTRYYLINPRSDNTGDVGKRCEEFLKSRHLENIAFTTELLVNEFLNKILEDKSSQRSENIIVLRLRIIAGKLEIIFWDRGKELLFDKNDSEEKDTFSSMFIIENLIEKMTKNRLAEVNETIFIINLEELPQNEKQIAL